MLLFSLLFLLLLLLRDLFFFHGIIILILFEFCLLFELIAFNCLIVRIHNDLIFFNY